MKANYLLRLSMLFLLPLAGCSSNSNSGLHFRNRNQTVPVFNADSAYLFIAKQVKMGPRAPGTKAHREAELYLKSKLQQYGGHRNVFVQHFTHKGYSGDSLAMANIIAAFNPQAKDRILLCAHWDSRPRADNDSVRKNAPILGADDGGSGVAVLLELARLFHKKNPPVGVDIILFDGEDYGKEGDLSHYFLGARYWSNHPPVKNYHPRFGILLDMVGGRRARFPKEQNSMRFAPSLVNEVWSIAQNKGFDSTFVDRAGARISDDHLPLNRIRHIPTIDIVRHRVLSNGEVEFAPYWHTHRDDLKIIDRHTLKAVGEVLSEFVYNHL